MIAFDTDVLTGILLGNDTFVKRASMIPVTIQAVSIITVEEIMRGRLNIIRQAEAGKSRVSIDRAYTLFQETFSDFQHVQVLAYTSRAESLYQQWRNRRIKVSTHDLRIAAICVDHRATLISRNRKDFERVPDLKVEFWT